MSDTIKLDTKVLDSFLKAFKGKLPVAHVGVLAGKTNRTTGNKSNADIGKKHEFGEITQIGSFTVKLPERSFLRVPIIEHMQSYLEKSGAFTKDVLTKVVKEKSLREWVAKLGIVGERIVLDGFDSGGFGQWKPSNMRFKKTGQTLIESQQLRNSITSEVVG